MSQHRNRKSSDHHVHYRRCHLCNHVTERAEEQVEKCDHCGKPVAPFFFFDDAGVPALSTDLPRMDLLLSTTANERLPIRGLTARW